MYGIKALGCTSVPITPTVSTKIYNSVCMSKLLYGYEIINISHNSLDKLENVHVNSLKTLTGTVAIIEFYCWKNADIILVENSHATYVKYL